MSEAAAALGILNGALNELFFSINQFIIEGFAGHLKKSVFFQLLQLQSLETETQVGLTDLWPSLPVKYVHNQPV